MHILECIYLESMHCALCQQLTVQYDACNRLKRKVSSDKWINKRILPLSGNYFPWVYAIVGVVIVINVCVHWCTWTVLYQRTTMKCIYQITECWKGFSFHFHLPLCLPFIVCIFLFPMFLLSKLVHFAKVHSTYNKVRTVLHRWSVLISIIL